MPWAAGIAVADLLPAWPEAEALAYWFWAHLSLANLRVLFYAVSPAETTFQRVEDVPDYTMQVSAWWALLILVELLLLCLTGHSDRMALNDSLASISAGIMTQLIKSSGRAFSLLAYSWIWQHCRLVDLDSGSPQVWAVCLVSQDLVYYLGHRAMHEISLLWAFHSVHHSGQYLNLSTAFRQPILQDIGLAPYELLQALAVPPPLFLVHRYFSHIFQFWLHTSLLGSLGPLGLVLNTPAFHRVHHGRNAYCLDKNFGALLIVWDRLFGTFQAENLEEPPEFGLATGERAMDSFNQCWMQLAPLWRALVDKPFRRKRNGSPRFPGLKAKAMALLWPPGWQPTLKTHKFFHWQSLANSEGGKGKQRLKQGKKPLLAAMYNPPLSAPLKAYLLCHFFLLLCMFVHFQHSRVQLDWPEFSAKLLFLVASLLVFGSFFDQKKHADLAEAGRCLAFCLFQLRHAGCSPFQSSTWLLVAPFGLSAALWTVKRVAKVIGRCQAGNKEANKAGTASWANASCWP